MQLLRQSESGDITYWDVISNLITDQRSVSFMFDKGNHGKIKNEKISRWWIELSPFSYDIEYRDGTENVVADALTRFPTCNVCHHRKQP